MQGLLSATRPDRSKRGKYVKLPEEVQREIVDYARSTSNLHAARFYSERLGCQVYIAAYFQLSIDILANSAY